MPNNEPTSYDNFPGIDPTLPPEEVLAQFKNELPRHSEVIKGFTNLLLQIYLHPGPHSEHDKWLKNILSAANFVDALISSMGEYLESGIASTHPPQEVLAQFKNELGKYPVMIGGFAHLLLEHYPQTDPNSKHDEWLQIISKTADDIGTLIRFVHDYLEKRASLPK